MLASNVGNKRIWLPVHSVVADEALMSNPVAFRHHAKLWVANYPEIFPPQIAAGFWLHDFGASRKLNLRMRRIRLRKTGEVSQLRPEFVIPYMIDPTDAVEKGGYLQRYGVAFDALAWVFGRDASYRWLSPQGFDFHPDPLPGIRLH